MIKGKRYIICRNEAEAEKDRKDREAIVAALYAQLKKADKALIGNSAYRRYLRKSAGARTRPKATGRLKSTLANSQRRRGSIESSCCAQTPT